MTPWDDLEDEMRRLPLDDGTADRLLSGLVEADDAPPGYAAVARLLRAAGAPATADELAREPEAVTAAAAAVRVQRGTSVVPQTRRHKMRSRFFRVKVVGLAAAGMLVGSAGLAAAGALPDSAQNVASDVLAKIGISVPSGSEHPASTGEDISGLATTTDLIGVAKGAAISSLASGGVSQAGQHGSAVEGAGSLPTPADGAGVANTASHGHSGAGTGNAP